jgi:hypothetical protein
LKRFAIICAALVALSAAALGIVAHASNSGQPKRLPDAIATGRYYHDAGTRFAGPSKTASQPVITSDQAADIAGASVGPTPTGPGLASTATYEQVTFGTFLPPEAGVGMVATPTPGYAVTFWPVCLRGEFGSGCQGNQNGAWAVYIDAVSGSILGQGTTG